MDWLVFPHPIQGGALGKKILPLNIMAGTNCPLLYKQYQDHAAQCNSQRKGSPDPAQSDDKHGNNQEQQYARQQDLASSPVNGNRHPPDKQQNTISQSCPSCKR
jgi:hypothetical protein